MTRALDIATLTLWQEARGEPEIGQRAVAHVIVNRMHDGRWGPNLMSVCLWTSQFSGWRAKDPNFIPATELSEDDPLYLKLRGFLGDALIGGQDPTQGATHYFATSIPDPPWVNGATFCGQFGAQKFYKDVR